MTDPASGCEPSAATTSGPTTSSRSAPIMDANSACSTSSTSSLTNAWPSAYPAGSNRSTSSTYCRTCSSCAACRRTSVPMTAPNSSPRRSRIASARSAYNRPDNCPESVAKAVQDWISAVGAKTAYITPGSPWENGYIESFNARLRDELLDGEIFYTLREAEIVIESWRRHYNTVRPHASIGYRAPAPEVFVPALAAWPAAQSRPAPPAMLPLAPRPTPNSHANRTH